MLIVGKFPILARFIHKRTKVLSEKLEAAYSPIFAAKIVILSIFVIASITWFILSLACLFFAALYEV